MNKNERQQLRNSDQQSIILTRQENIKRRVSTQVGVHKSSLPKQLSELKMKIRNKDESINGRQQKSPPKKKVYTDSSQNTRMKSIYQQYQQSQLQVLLSNRNSNHQLQQTVSERDQILEKLINKNRVLKDNIYRIQKLQEESLKKNMEKRQYSSNQIYFAFSTKDSLEKQLHNAYAKIHRMEAQINQIKKALNRDQKKHLQILKSRIQQIELLKNQTIKKLEELKKLCKKNQQKVEKLKKSGGYQQIISQLAKQCEILEQKQKQLRMYEEKRKQKVNKQQEYIRNLQKQLIQNGVSREYLQDLMNRIMSKEKVKQANQPVQQTKKQSKQKQLSQYKKMIHQINILQKSICQQEKYIKQITPTQKQISQRLSKAITISRQLDEKIQNVELEILQIRKVINPANLKPKPLPPKQQSLEEKKKQQNQHLKEMRKKFYEKKTKKYLQGLQSSDIQANQFNQFEDKDRHKQRDVMEKQQSPQNSIEEQKVKELSEVNIKQQSEKGRQQNIQYLNDNQIQIFGQVDPNGIVFSDKKMEEKFGQLNCKMTGMSVTIQQGLINGITAVYNYNLKTQLHQFTPNTIKRSNKKTDKKSVQEFMCIEDEFIISISGFFSQKKILQSLTILTNLNRYHKFGSVLQNQQRQRNNSEDYKTKQFEISTSAGSYPVYIMGCINRDGICQFGAKIAKQNDSASEDDQQYQNQ